MFGYLTAYQQGLGETDKRLYQAYYCGLCRRLSERYGRKSSLILAYDPVLLAILYSDLYDGAEEISDRRCLYKGAKVPVMRTESLDFAADVNLMLAYHNYSDQVYDSRKKRALRALHFLDKEYREAAGRYPEKDLALRAYMEALHECESRNSDNPDEAANLTGEMCREVFLFREDEYAKYLRPVFFGLGKFVYLLDAFSDLPKDEKSGNYNPYSKLDAQRDCAALVLEHLESVMGACTEAFEKLPLIEHRDLLRNILYAGVWIGYRKAAKEREEKETRHVL